MIIILNFVKDNDLRWTESNSCWRWEKARTFWSNYWTNYHPEVDVKDLCSSAKDALMSVIRHKPDIISWILKCLIFRTWFFENLKELNLLSSNYHHCIFEPTYYKRPYSLDCWLPLKTNYQKLDTAIQNAKARISSHFTCNRSTILYRF